RLAPGIRARKRQRAAAGTEAFRTGLRRANPGPSGRGNASSFRSLYALLRSEGRPRLPALIAVFGFASLTAFAQKAPILLMEPLLKRVLFPQAASEAAKGESGWFEPVVAAKHRLYDALFGT